MDIQKNWMSIFIMHQAWAHDKGKVSGTTGSGKVIAEYQEAPSEV